MVVPEATGWLTINYLSFIHGVIADVNDGPWVCLSGSVCDSGSEEKEGKEMRDCVKMISILLTKRSKRDFLGRKNNT